MRKLISIIGVFLMSFNIAFAQNDAGEEWQASANGSEYHCETLLSVLTAIQDQDAEALTDLGEEVVARSENGDELGVNSYVGSAVLFTLSQDADVAFTTDDLFSDGRSACSPDTETTVSDTTTSVDEFPIVVNGDVNLRACAGTDCDILGIAEDDSLLTVIGIDGDWYQVELEDGTTAFIASSLTTRGPDAIISVDDYYTDPVTRCDVAFDMKRGDMNMTLIITGARQDEVVADLYRPNETHALRVEGQLDKTFIDTGDTYIHQYYSWNVSWPTGVYQLEIKLDDNVSKLAWELENTGDYNIFVICE